MADKKLKVGDPVLWYGFALTVTALEENENGQTVAVVEESEKAEAREAAYAEIREIREKQAAETVENRLPPGEWEKMRDRIAELDAVMREAIVRARLRADLLSYWQERKVWVSDGRILTDAQREQFQSITGAKPKPDGERQALAMLEAVA